MDAERLAELRSLLSDRAEIKDEIERQKAELARIEERIGLLVASENGPVKVAGFGSVVLSKPSLQTRFDAQALRELIQSLNETGQQEIAAEIAACIKTSELAGSLRISPERNKDM